MCKEVLIYEGFSKSKLVEEIRSSHNKLDSIDLAHL